MSTIDNFQKNITSALEELCADPGISESDFGCKLIIKDKDPLILQS